MLQHHIATHVIFHKVQTSGLLSSTTSAQKSVSQYDALLLRCESNSGDFQQVKKLLCMPFSQKHSVFSVNSYVRCNY